MTLGLSRRQLLGATLLLGVRPATATLAGATSTGTAVSGAPPDAGAADGGPATGERRDGGPPVQPTPPPELGGHLHYVPLESEALRGNLIGDPHVRLLAVLLPPSYFTDLTRRYPTVYLLHGVGSRRDGHKQIVPNLHQTLASMRSRKLAEAVFVAVDGTTSFGGSYYTNSPTIGNFADYVAQEVVARVDGLFRTIRARGARAVTGFSMGGHGAIKLAMRNPTVFGRIGSLSGSPMSIRYRKMIYKGALQAHRVPETLVQLLSEITFERNWSLAAAYAKAAAFSPNPDKPPFFLDLPFQSSGDDDDDPIWQKWWDDDPLSLVAQHKQALRSLDLMYFDHGDNETALGTEDFDRELVRYGIGHIHHVFRGDHSDKLPQRFARMLSFVANNWDV